MSSREPHSYWQMLFPNATCFFLCRLFEHGVPLSVSVQIYFVFFLHKNCSVPQEGGGHGAGCNSMTPPMKTNEASAWVCCTENFRRSARRAAGCRKMMRDLRMSTTNPGNGRKTTSLKLLQVATKLQEYSIIFWQRLPTKHVGSIHLLIFLYYMEKRENIVGHKL